jgi:hypothetical protein
MNTFLLIAMLVFGDGYQLIGVEPFKTQTECEAQRQSILSNTYGKVPRDRQFVVSCAPILTAGVGA